MHIRKRSVEVLALVNRAIIIILTVHHLEIILESLLDLLNYVALGRIWVHWLSSLPVVSRFEKGRRLDWFACQKYFVKKSQLESLWNLQTVNWKLSLVYINY